MKADFLIVGGGVIGLSIARELASRSVGSVAVLERGLLGNESSSAAAGMLAVQAETDCADDFFDFCLASKRLYPDFADALISETGIDIELDTTGTLYLALNETDAAEIRHRFEWQTAANLKVERLTLAEVLKLEPNVNPLAVEALLFDDDWQVENKKLVDALAASCISKGVTIIENCDIISLITDGHKVSGVRSAGTEHFGDTVVLATGAWTSLIECDGSALPEIKPIKGEMVSFGPERGILRHVMYSPRGYLVPRSDGRILAGATVEDVGFDKSITSAAEKSVSDAAFEIVPRLGELEIKTRWAGLRPFGPGGRPIIGRIPNCGSLIVATGHYRNGILLAPATAALVADIIQGNETRFAHSFNIGKQSAR